MHTYMQIITNLYHAHLDPLEFIACSTHWLLVTGTHAQAHTHSREREGGIRASESMAGCQWGNGERPSRGCGPAVSRTGTQVVHCASDWHITSHDGIKRDFQVQV